MKEYRTEEYRLKPDKTQKDAICRKFELADAAFDEIAATVNTLAADGNNRSRIETAVENYTLITSLNTIEVCAVRNAVKKTHPEAFIRRNPGNHSEKPLSECKDPCGEGTVNPDSAGYDRRDWNSSPDSSPFASCQCTRILCDAEV